MQGELFDSADLDRRGLAEKLTRLAARGIYLGTSSWKYEGWLGQLYSPSQYLHRGRVAKSRFESDCLAEYANVFSSVCVDAAYYQFPSEKFLERLHSQVPDGFQFTYKATEHVTVKRFPRLARYGAVAGMENKRFLDAACFEQEFLGPLAPYQDQTGVIIFEFSAFAKDDFVRGREFVDGLEEFLAALPQGWRFGVEIRNAEFLRPEYFEMLRRCGAAHVFNQWSRMPTVSEQLELEGAKTASFDAARFLLTPGRTYEEAVKAFSPYRETQAADAGARAALARLVLDANQISRRAVFAYVNNRLEGNALRTIEAVLASLPA